MKDSSPKIKFSKDMVERIADYIYWDEKNEQQRNENKLKHMK